MKEQPIETEHYSLSLHKGYPQYKDGELILYAGHSLPKEYNLNDVLDHFIDHLEDYKK